MAFSTSAGIGRPPEARALIPGSRKTGTHALLDHRALELRKDTHHLKHRPAGRRRGVEALLMQEQVNASGVDFG